MVLFSVSFRTGQLITFSRPFVIFFPFSKVNLFCIYILISLFSSVSSRRKCLSSPDSFCSVYICDSFTTGNQKANISAFVKQAYLAYFKEELGDQDKPWVPHKVCKNCVESLLMWTKGTREKLTFGVIMVWRESKDHCTDCYFCLANMGLGPI